MGVLKMVFHLGVAGVLFWIFVVEWALVPYLDAEVDLNLTVISAFYGNNPPTGAVRELLLAARACLGVGASLFAIIPAGQILVEYEPRPLQQLVVIVFAVLSVVVFFISLVVQQLYYI